MQDGERALTRCYTRGRGTLMKKAEEGKATQDLGRESLARLLALERYRNLIETNTAAGITLYTDHKPGLYENSLSNKGRSALGDFWRQRICSP